MYDITTSESNQQDSLIINTCLVNDWIILNFYKHMNLQVGKS